jgi:pectate lyase
MIARRISLFALVVLAALLPRVFAATYFVAPDGTDIAAGSEAAPFATIMRAQSVANAGDTVYLRGGTYMLGDANITRTDSTYAYVNDFTKSGISYLAYPGETPVFDFSAVKPAARRVTAFFIRANNLRFAGFHVVGVQVTIKTGEASNTQSENFRITNGSGNTLERLVLRDGMGIGVYITGGSANNLVLNCDAYNNAGLDSLSMGNVDGFGAHTSASGSGNVFRGCRAWLNSDDGFDLINCQAATVIENCWAAFSGYVGASLAVGADGNGFKAGGYGRNGSAMPSPMPRHVVRFSLAVRNRASGFYANHHGGGLDFVHNTAFQNATNYNLLNVLADNLTDVPGYDHYLKNNLGFSPRSTSVSNLDQAACDVSHNFFTLPVTVTSADFVSTTTNTPQLLAIMATPRQADGSLPAIDLLRLANGSDVIDVGLPLAGFAFNQAAPDLGCFENGFVPAPSGLSATPGDNSVGLAWTALPGENRYTVARGADAVGPFAVIATDVSGTAYADGTAVNGTTYHYVVAAYNGFGSSAYSAAVSAKPLGPVAKWIGGFFGEVSDPTIIGPAADPDGDGLPNLLEYFVGANPAASDFVTPLRLERSGVDSGETWVLRFLAAKEVPGVSYRIEASSDLAAWAEETAVPTVEGEVSGRWSMRVDLGEILTGTFWRLRVTQTGG